MSLVFTAITPHTPFLIPAIGKENLKKIDKTKRSLEKLEEELYASHPEMLVIISPHGTLYPDAFTLNYAPELETDLRDFGDLVTTNRYRGEPRLPYGIRSTAKKHHLPVVINSEKKVDHGVSIPLFYLVPHLPKVTILPLGFSGRSAKDHLDFGYIIKDQIMKTTKRIAVIASAELSHALLTDGPAGYNPAGPEFDARVQELLGSHNTTGMVQLDEQLVKDAAECGYRSLLILLGILRDVRYTYESFAYEGPFGVGYLTANFVL